MRSDRLAMLALLVAIAACGQPKVELKLTLSKDRWEEGESLWYKLEVKNVGWRTVEITDPAWLFQNKLPENAQDKLRTYLSVTDSNGKEWLPTSLVYGIHGEMSMWTNDCGNGVLCDKVGFKSVVLKRGQTLTATPSVESPVRSNFGTVGVADIRGCSGKSLSAEDCAGVKRFAEDLGKYGDARRMVDSQKAAKEQPLGFRILDTVQLPGPGKYTIQAVMDMRSPLPPVSAEEDLATGGWCSGVSKEACRVLEERVRLEWERKSPEALAEIRRERELVSKYNAAQLHVVSRVLEFEVVPAKRAGPALGEKTPSDSVLETPDSRALDKFFKSIDAKMMGPK